MGKVATNADILTSTVDSISTTDPTVHQFRHHAPIKSSFQQPPFCNIQLILSFQREIQMQFSYKCLCLDMWTQYVMKFASQKFKILRDLITLLAYHKQHSISTGQGFVGRFFERHLISHCCDVIWISNDINLSKINCIELTFLCLFRTCVHVYALREKACIWHLRLLSRHPFSVKTMRHAVYTVVWHSRS